MPSIREVLDECLVGKRWMNNEQMKGETTPLLLFFFLETSQMAEDRVTGKLETPQGGGPMNAQVGRGIS